jgi:hypothetical protein
LGKVQSRPDTDRDVDLTDRLPTGKSGRRGMITEGGQVSSATAEEDTVVIDGVGQVRKTGLAASVRRA